MALQSNLFANDRALEACSTQASAHVVPGATGPHVKKIQAALVFLGSRPIDKSEIDAGRYGPSTAAAVLALKKARDIVNRSYQTQADDIVGVMTIAALDRELKDKQAAPRRSTESGCDRRISTVGQAERNLLVANTARRGGARIG